MIEEIMPLQLEDLLPILREQICQFQNWGLQHHNPHKWMTILTEEVGEVAEVILESESGSKAWEDVIEELVQVQAVAQSMIESIRINQVNQIMQSHCS